LPANAARREQYQYRNKELRYPRRDQWRSLQETPTISVLLSIIALTPDEEIDL
jgi:hypothetical protein